MTIRYQTDLQDITPSKLEGFFEGWQKPRTPDEHLGILEGSTHIVLAVDDEAERVVGFITALGDSTQAAFIPLLEVIPEYRHQGIGSMLVKLMLDELRDYPCIDLTCDPEMQPFYGKLGLTRSVGMVVRRY